MARYMMIGPSAWSCWTDNFAVFSSAAWEEWRRDRRVSTQSPCPTRVFKAGIKCAVGVLIVRKSGNSVRCGR
eukprot:807744-Amphidinium_carterae.1